MVSFAKQGPVVAVGEAMVEFFRNADGSWCRGFAGDTLNVAWALRALLPPGQPVDYLTRVGNDDTSAEMVDFIARAGIGTSGITRDPDRGVGLYTIATDAKGERSFTYWRGISAARRLGDDAGPLVAGLAGARLIYLSGITAAVLDDAGRENLLGVLAQMRKGGAVIAYDPNYRPRLWADVATMRAFTTGIGTLAAIVLPTLDDEVAGFGDADAEATIRRLTGLGATEIVVKDSIRPALIRADGRISSLPVSRPVSPLDTTGAGDSFNGAYLAARLLGQPPISAAKAAQRVAAAVVGARGALLPPDALRCAFHGPDAAPDHAR